MKRIAVFLLCLLCHFTIVGCSGGTYSPADDEIALQIQLDVKEDIGLLCIYYEANETSCSGGVSNANKTPIKHNEKLVYTINQNTFKNADDVEKLSVRFAIVTEYCAPNYENDYPDEYVKTMDAIHLNGKYGEAYSFTITGDKASGYAAVLNHADDTDTPSK